MSQQLVLDIPGASARSKGQARRRNQPAQSEDTRKAQRNLARRERARCKKMGATEQQLRSSVQPSPYADKPQYGAPLPVKEKTAQRNSELPLQPHRPAFTVFPTHANVINLRALAQSNRYAAAQSMAQETKDALRGGIQQARDVSIIQARDGFESRIPLEENNLDAAVAGILVEVAKGQHAIFAAMDNGTISVNTGGETEAHGAMEYPQKCPVTTCEYHRKGFSLKVERDKHTRTHYKGDIKFGFIENPENGSNNVEHLKHLKNYSLVHQDWVPSFVPSFREDLNCGICFRHFIFSSYLEHLDDCIVHMVELEASGRAQACPVSSCYYHDRDFASKFHREQHIVKHYWRPLSCCWCHQQNRIYSLDEFRSHVSVKHGLDVSREWCPVCSHFMADGKELLEHLDSCVVLEVEKEARRAS